MTMKSPRTRWPRPSRALGLLAIAGVLGAWIMVARPVPSQQGPPALVGPPLAVPGGPKIVTYPVVPEPTGPVDRCLIPAPEVDDRFAVSAPQVDDRMAVRPLVSGMPVNSR